ncbi:MAG: NUDIX domain-containing protein [Bacteroidales bacterium]
MALKSAGILLYRLTDSKLEVLLVHPGGPFWSRKDFNSWSIPKGEFTEDEDPLDAARREFEEEIGIPLSGNFIELTPVRQKSGKQVFCYACEGNIDPQTIKSNTFEMEWPPKSGRRQAFPEIDRGEWFGIAQGKLKIIESQAVLIDELIIKLNLTKDQLLRD